MINGSDSDVEFGKGMKAFMEAVYELEQMATRGDVYCDQMRVEVEKALKDKTYNKDLEDKFYWAKAIAIENFIRSITQ